MQTQQHKPPTSARKPLIAALVASVLALAATAVCLRGFFLSFPRLEIAGFRVSEDAYHWAMYEARNDVLSAHAEAGISLKDWSQETELGDPCRLITERALEILSEYYAVGTLAVERGYLDDAGYEAMLQDMKYVNHERQAALDSGVIITGLPQFTASNYITYRAASIRQQFCTDAENAEYEVSEEDLRQRYEDDKGDLYVMPDDLELAFVVVNADPEETEALEPELQALRELALEGGDLTQALEAFPGLKSYYEEITVDRSTYSVYARSHPDVLYCAEELQAGDISQVFQQEGWLCLIQCLQRTEHNYVPLEDVESVVLQSIREDRYDSLITGRMADMEIHGDLEALYRFTAEQFR